MVISPAMRCLVSGDAEGVEQFPDFTRKAALELQSPEQIGKIV